MTIQYLIAFPTGSVNSVRTVPCSPLNGQPQLWAWNMVGTQEMFLEYKNESRGGGLETSACKAVAGVGLLRMVGWGGACGLVPMSHLPCSFAPDPRWVGFGAAKPG